nr:reverse transcriptase domain-containing protein [Tanacetum cinerariifolium]
MQNLNKKIAALSRFLSKSAEKTLPLMKTLKSYTSGKMVQWTKEADKSFRRMKECLESLPTMVMPTKGKTLTMYLATSEENVSDVLMAERGKKQILVYFVSRTLHGAELNDKPIKQILAKPKKSGCIAKWAIELGEHEIEFRGRNSIKGKILADFLVETSLIENREAKNKEVKRKEPKPENAWKLFTDGASSFDGSGAGLMVVSPEGKEYTYALRFRRPQAIISDNGKQFVEGMFPIFCKKLGTLQASMSVYHPQENGHVEVTNREIIKGMERRLGKAHQAWIDELPQVLWAHRTTPNSSNGETPFSLVYGSKAVIHIEISVETKRVQDFDPKEKKATRRPGHP